MNPTRTLPEILDALYRNFGVHRLTGRPYNRFRPQQTLWWLVPTTEYPTHKYCKFYVEQPISHETVEVGLFVEKGVGYPSSEQNKKLLLDLDWYWSKLLMNNAERLREIIGKIANLSNAYESYIELSFPPLENKHMESLSDQALEQYKLFPQLIVHFKGGAIQGVEVRGSEYASPTIFHLLRRYTTIADIESLVDLFEELSQPNTEYAAQWVDAKFGAQVQSSYTVEAFLEDLSEHVFEDAPDIAAQS